MVFNSFEFLIFFPIVVLVYLFIPKRFRTTWLLISSYYFYMSWNPKYAILILTSTAITFVSGLLIEKAESLIGKKIVVLFSLISNLSILIIFKYANFFLDIFSSVSTRLGLHSFDNRLDILLPVGISFYTFQALSYTLDVYRGTIESEKNFLRYALFVSFFPQLVAGPIERSGNLLSQIQNIEGIKVFNFDRIRDGLMLMFWGLFQKLVIADRISILVNEVYKNYQKYGFVELSIASVLFAFQIYCDFGGYSNIAVGAAKVMGFNLMNNFRQPYFATNIKSFWRRWHISLTSWFTDYLYIPLGGNRKGKIRQYINILIVFGLSGLWHGAGLHFVAWGIIHAIYQIIGNVKYGLEKKIGITYDENTYSLSKKIRKGIGTFILVDVAWIFFAADSIRHVIGIFSQMFSNFATSSIFEIGFDKVNWQVLGGALIIMFIVDMIHEKGISILEYVSKQESWFRILFYSALIWSIIMLGAYGTGYDASQFIYFRF